MSTRPTLREPRLNSFQNRSLESFLSGQAAVIDTLRILAFQVNFSDSVITAGKDSTHFANEMKHLEQYFDGASRDNLTMVWRVAPAQYTLPEPVAYYGDDAVEDVRVVEMMESIISLADADEDFSQYDTYMLIHAGPGQETDILDNSRYQLFSTFLDAGDIDAAFPDSSVAGLATADSLGGAPFFVTNFMVVPERPSQDGETISSLGIWAFLTGSRIGLVPLFDSTPSTFPDSRGVGDFDLMSNGLFNIFGFVPGFPSAFNRVLAGWLDPLVVEADGDFRLHDVNVPAVDDTACIKIPITETEYFLVVNRVHDTNFDSLFTFSDFDSNLAPGNTDSLGGAEFDFYLTWTSNPGGVKFDPNYGTNRPYFITGSGLYVWHVDETVIRQNVAAGFLPNDFASRKGVDLEEADGIPDLDNSFSSFSFGSHFDSFRAGHNDTFGPATNPGSVSNGGAPTGLTITNISLPDSFMTVSVQFAKPYSEVRTRWAASARHQPPTAIDLDGSGGLEVVCLADSGRIYAFNGDGSEFIDGDANPATIDPYISVAGAEWLGAPAFGDIDGGGDAEMVAFDAAGTVYAWKLDGSEVTDGDSNPATTGVLFVALPFAAPPALVDVDGNAQLDIVMVQLDGDSLEVAFIDGSGAQVLPADAAIAGAFWPARAAGQASSPVGYGAVGGPAGDTEGITLVAVDSLVNRYTLYYWPVRQRSGSIASERRVDIPAVGAVDPAFSPTSSPAIGDLDGDGFDDVVFTIPDGRLVVHSARSRFDPAMETTIGSLTAVAALRSTNPSSVALGDIDGNGTLEIALWDDEFFYLYENNARLRTNWPQKLRETTIGSFPPMRFDPRLTSPLMGDVDGDGVVELLFPTSEGTVRGYRADAGAVASFPRPGPAMTGATGTIEDLDGGGTLEFVSLGSPVLIETFESVSDTIFDTNQLVLTIQSLPGSDAAGTRFWFAYHHDATRLGRVTEPTTLQPTSDVVVPNSFIVYPNPVRGSQVHVRIALNSGTNVTVEIYNLEGERALSREFTVQAAPQTPFDEPLDVSRLASGVYMMRLVAGGESFVKTFAIVR